MKGFQDTLYTYGENSRQYYENCYIEGTTDFIFGKSTAWFENCTIHSKQNSYITAAATPENVTYGYVFNKCRLTADDGVEKVYLGRPWRPYAAVLFTKCEMGNIFAPKVGIIGEKLPTKRPPATANTKTRAKAQTHKVVSHGRIS